MLFLLFLLILLNQTKGSEDVSSPRFVLEAQYGGIALRLLLFINHRIDVHAISACLSFAFFFSVNVWGVNFGNSTKYQMQTIYHLFGMLPGFILGEEMRGCDLPFWENAFFFDTGMCFLKTGDKDGDKDDEWALYPKKWLSDSVTQFVSDPYWPCFLLIDCKYIDYILYIYNISTIKRVEHTGWNKLSHWVTFCSRWISCLTFLLEEL